MLYMGMTKLNLSNLAMSNPKFKHGQKVTVDVIRNGRFVSYRKGSVVESTATKVLVATLHGKNWYSADNVKTCN